MVDKKLKIVTIGGGTGSFTLLTELKELPDLEITAVVAMSDSGGSTGRLRVDMGVLPAGDARQALVALSHSPETLRKLFTYRYDTGDVKGHTFGNLFLSTLEKISGSLEEAIMQAGKMLRVRGRIYPVTLHKHELVVHMSNGEKIVGEGEIDNRYIRGYSRMYLSEGPQLNPCVERAIAEADIVIIAPGNFYCSIVPNFLVAGLTEALHSSKARSVMVANLLTKEGHTDGYDVIKFLNNLKELSRGFVPDTVVYNKQEKVTQEIEQVYKSEGGSLVTLGDDAGVESFKDVEFLGGNLIAMGPIATQSKADIVKRSLLRHDAKRVLQLLGLGK